MNADDYAILVGINRYPELGEGNSPIDLQGPGNDVQAIRAWLLDPAGGGFPDAGKILEVAVGSGATGPTAEQLDRLVSQLDDIAQANRKARKGMQVGRRLYIYMSGHGFSPARQRACLFTADAKERLGLNVHATGWLTWLQDAAYFREFVLWVDACMNRVSFVLPHDPPLPLAAASIPPRASFVAFAAQRPLKAVEAAMPEDADRMHGVFTWTLLEGLRGAAADANGRVTGRSLADWLRNAQSARYSPRDREDRDVAQEPEVVQEDAALIFTRGVGLPAYAVGFSFPAAARGAIAQLWAGSPFAVTQRFVVGDTPKTLSLKPGLYLMEVADAGLRHAFEVVQPTAIAVTETGAPVQPCEGSEVFQLDVETGDPAAEIFVVDTRFSLVDCSTLRLSTPLPPGLFKVKVRIGNAVNQRVLLLDRDHPAASSAVAQPQLLATVVPLPQTSTTHEYHQAARFAAIAAAQAVAAGTEQSAVLVMVRNFSTRQDVAQGVAPPWLGVSIVDAFGELVVDLESQSVKLPNDDACAYCAARLEPGSYFLRQQFDDGHALEQSLILCPGWRTELFVLRQVLPGSNKLDPRPRVSVMMRRLGDGLDIGVDEEDRAAEAAKLAMASERRILSAELEETLMLKSRNPVAGIIGGHLLLIERERDPGRDITMLDTVVRNLRTLLGNGHPDVEALALQCADPALRRVGTLTGPPMFQRSWALLAQGARKRVNLVPADMWARVQAQGTLPPFLVWNTDELVKSAARVQLARAVFGTTMRGRLEVPGHLLRNLVVRVGPEAVQTLAAARRNRELPSADLHQAPSRMVRARAASMQVPPCAIEALKSEKF